MLCTKIHIYIKFPVDTDGNWSKIIIRNMIYLISKIFHRSLLVNLLVNFQNGFGDLRPQPIWFFWPISIKNKILAPESALGAKHFKSCVILGHPIWTPFDGTWNKIKHHFLNIDQTRTRLSFCNWTRTPSYWFCMNIWIGIKLWHSLTHH